MSNRHQPTARKSSDQFFRLKPLAAGVRVVLAGGLLVGSVAPAHAAGLPVPVPGQGWVSSGAATNQVIGNTLRIDQQTDRAILNWKSFNVDREKTVQFVQPSSTSIALNRINQQDASRIMGKIIANGQVYLYNKNGFVFGKDSVVNANSFMASTLEITDEAFNRGITRVFDEDGSAALGIDGVTLDPKTVKILIEAGARIHADKAGRIIIAAPTIENKGSLSTEAQGQVILAASQDKVYLQAADKSSPFAGLVVEVETGGKVSNLGNILARQGNVTLAGFAVNQQGRISATSSVNVNGSIRLLAQEKHGTQGTKLIATKTDRDSDLNDGLGTQAKTTFAAGSVTQIVADADGGSAIDEQAQPNAYLQVTGNTVHMQSGSIIKAPGGKIDITATDKLTDPTQGTKGRIVLEKGAVIDVSGNKGIEVPMERNVGEISVQSFELRDAPQQRTGVLKGETVRVDLRKDTRIVDTSGARARISRGIDERLGTGGEINLTSSGDVLIDEGAKIDISGGSVRYQDGYIKTTKLLTEYGSIVDISDADPNQRYLAIFGTVTESHQKWGVEKIWDLLGQIGLGQFEHGYVEGKAAGRFNIQAPRVAWNGDLVAGSSAGRYQRDSADVPFGGSFDIDMAVFQSLQNVRFQTEGNHLQLPADQAFPETGDQQPIDLVIATSLLNDSGVKDVSVRTWGDATLAGDASIDMGPGGSLSVAAGNIDMDGSFKAAGGKFSLKAATNALVPEAGRLTMGAKAALDMSGLWINDFQRDRSLEITDLLAIEGGIVNLQAEGDLLVNAGSSIRADGGAWLPVSGKLKAGKGGDITLAAVGNGSVASTLILGGELSAYGLFENGGLTLASGKIIVGSPDATDELDQSLKLTVSDGNFDFSRQLAFSRISLAANFEDLTVNSNVNLDLRQKNLELLPGYEDAVTGSSLRNLTQIVELPEHLRLPVKLDLAGRSGVTFETGSTIKADKGSAIKVSSTAGGIFVDGSVQAQGGQIDFAIKPASGLEYDARQTIWIGKHARLLAQGTTRLNPTNVLGYRSGEVLDGGGINFNAERGAVVLVEGSLLDVSGTSAQLDILQATNGKGSDYAMQTIASDAGDIKIAAAEGIVLDGSMRAVAGSSAAHGGRLELTLDRSKRNQPDEPQIPFPSRPEFPLVMNVTQSARRSMEEDVNFGDEFPTTLNGKLLLSADRVMAGGFADLSLTTPDFVQFVGDVNLTTKERIAINAPVISAVGENTVDAGSANLNTVFLQMGSSLNRELADTAEQGSGRFSGHAQWIQLSGATRWDGFSQINLDSAHEIRAIGLRNADDQRDFVGGLVTAADLNLHASQIYPSTLSDFTFAVKNNPNGQITISGANTDTSPLSAGGSLTFEAPVINQQGVLKAPLGNIYLKAGKSLTLAENSLTSVSAAGQLIPFGVTQGGLDWLYPLGDGLRNLFGAELEKRLEKRLVISAPQIDIQKGSVIDVSGGGDLQSYEFEPGAGGSFDYLQPGSASYQGGFAVLPSLGTQLAPHDHFESQGFPYAPGTTVYLKGSQELPAGEYAILPAHYALLPGAFLITPQADSQDLAETRFTVDGLPIVPGYMGQAGTGVGDTRSSGFKIENGMDVRLHSKYDTHGANEFFAQHALKNETPIPTLAMDGGHISLLAQTKLIMEGQFMTDALGGGKGARMDIAADHIVVTGQLSQVPAEGTLEILADNLNALKVDSLLLGGTRSRNKTQVSETDVEVSAQDVVFAGDADWQGAELIAAATDRVEVQGGASLNANRKAGSGDSVLNITGDGALLRVSGDRQVVLNRTETAGDRGELKVAAGAKLSALESMLMDASKSTQLLGDITMQGGSLNLSANTLNIGEVDNLAGNALNLSNRQLANLAVDELVLTARDGIGVYGTLGQVDTNGAFLTDQNGRPRAIRFEHLAINAAGIVGHGNAASKARLEAGKLELQNTAGAVNNQAADGRGQLELSADSVEIGTGQFSILGFETVDMLANKEFRASGKGGLNVGKDLNLTAALLTADGGSHLTVNAARQVNVHGLTSTTSVSGGFGGAIDMIADAINFNSKAILASGNFGLHALNGDVTLGGQASLDLAGRAIKFADRMAYTPGGHFKAVADHGKVITAAGSMINVSSGGGKAAGGSLTMRAPDQSVILSGQLKAKAGSASFDVNDFDSSTNFAAMVSALAAAGVDQSIYFRSRNADIIQHGFDINARDVTLVADHGSLSIAAGIHADAAERGGNINLYAGDKITLASGARLTALGTAVGVKGGKVLLSAVDTDNDGDSGIDIQGGSSIDVAGNGGSGGEVTLRALRNGNGINIQPIAGTVTGTEKFYAEGVEKYVNANLGNDGRIDSGDIATIRSNTAAYMTPANMLAVSNLAEGLHLIAGVEIDYTGDLTLNSKWDLAAWRYEEVPDAVTWNGLPGRLAIKTAGDFNVNQSLSDGFKNEKLNPGSALGGALGSPTNPLIADRLQRGESWSYNLVAGADVGSADINATQQAGNLVIGSNTVIRTGSGDIQIKAGGDITFTDGTASVYNAGRPDNDEPYGTLKERFVGLLFYSEYPVAGGDLSLTAGGNINGAVGNTDFNDWLLRIGNWTDSADHTGERPTAWGVALGYVTTNSSTNPAKSVKPLFQQNVGSFGGGNVAVTAGGTISNLDVVMPTTGKQVGTRDDSTATSLNFLTNQVEVNGGGNMQISAGGDIAGGTYYLGKGTGTLTAGGRVNGGSEFAKGPELLVGDTRFTVNAGNGASLTGVSDPMIMHKADVNFYSYSADSTINVSALSGDVLLGADGAIFTGASETNQQKLGRIYPASLNATAFGGNVQLTDEILLFPSPIAELNLLAEQAITGEVGIRLGMSDADRSLLPYPEVPLARNKMSEAAGRVDPFGFDPEQIHAPVPVHRGDKQPVRLVTRRGNIENIAFNLPKMALISSGHDIVNLPLSIQHANFGDVSMLEAARDLRYTSERDPKTGALLDNSAKIEVGGSGEVLIKTGRHADLGASGGVSTVGNVFNAGLPDQGANLTLLVGANGELDYAGFVGAYLKDSNQYGDAYRKARLLITNFMRQRLKARSLSASAAMKAFAKLKNDDFVAIQPQLNAIVLPVFFNEIKESGKASAGTDALGNERGYAAIASLFPGSGWNGNLSMPFSKIQTIDNGNINLLVPGGEVNAGLAVSFTGAKPASELGIVAQRQGDINVLVRDDFKVNTSRVFSLDGGDIMIWSSEGDIDAGRGAKSAIAAPPPVISFDENGNLKIEFPPIVSGSGIRTAASSAGVAPGDVYLFAPKGVVDAGEAGIGCNNCFIAATAVLGANNIQVSGVGTGVPVASTGSVAAGLTGTSNMTAGVSQAAESSVSANSDKDKSAAMKNAVLGMLSVEVLGFGE